MFAATTLASAALEVPPTCFKRINTTRTTTSLRAILPAADAHWRPVCTTSCCNAQLWPRDGKYCRRCDDRRCMQGERAVACCTTEKDAGTLAKGAKKTERGGWQLQASYTYFLDRGLAGELSKLVAGHSVVELGAGMGCYTGALRDAGRRGAGPHDMRGFDGAPGVAELSEGLVGEADLTTRLALGASDWVLSLEVAEHIPRRFEAQLFETLTSLARVGIVLSWSTHRGGRGHVNCRPTRYIVDRLSAR
eukprot:3669804-Prymnesium_polylepis.1